MTPSVPNLPYWLAAKGVFAVQDPDNNWVAGPPAFKTLTCNANPLVDFVEIGSSFTAVALLYGCPLQISDDSGNFLTGGSMVANVIYPYSVFPSPGLVRSDRAPLSLAN